MGTTPSKIQSQHFPAFESQLPSLSGKTIAITGCTSGTGFVAAKTAVRQSASHILLLNRPSERATRAEQEIQTLIQPGANTVVETIPCDLQDFESVRKCVETIKTKVQCIDVLCNNAGVMAMDDVPTKDGYDVQIQTNHLSHFMLVKELFPLLEKANQLHGEARIVHHTSVYRFGSMLKANYFGPNGGNLGGNREFFYTGPRWERYHQSKLANTVITVELAHRINQNDELQGIKSVAAAPGFALTSLAANTAQNGGLKGGMWMMRFAQSAEDGTMPLLAACFGPDTQNGDLWVPNGMAELAGLPMKKEFEKNTIDPNARKMLWQESEKCCGKFVL